MDSIVKQRLVGALVLIALTVVFWPIIFIQAPDDETIVLAPMPARPSFDRTPILRPTSPRVDIEAQLPKLSDQTELEAQADEASMLADMPSKAETSEAVALPSAAALDPVVPRNSVPAVTTIDKDGLAIAWVLQVATVSNQSRAEILMGRLKKRGYPAYIEQTKKAGKVLYRLKIGPKVERAKLEAIKLEIDAWLGVDATLLRYVQ